MLWYFILGSIHAKYHPIYVFFFRILKRWKNECWKIWWKHRWWNSMEQYPILIYLSLSLLCHCIYSHYLFFYWFSSALVYIYFASSRHRHRLSTTKNFSNFPSDDFTRLLRIPNSSNSQLALVVPEVCGSDPPHRLTREGGGKGEGASNESS